MSRGQTVVDLKNEASSNPFQTPAAETVWTIDRFLELIIDIKSRIQNHGNAENMGEFKSIVAGYMDELKSLALETRKYEQDRSEQLSRCVSSLQKNLEEARAEDLGNKLTQLANLAAFDCMLLHWIADHENSGEPFTLALIDLDDFSRINDAFGREVGDQILAFVALEIGGNIRDTDFLARCGGDKFGVLSSGMALADAEKRFSKLLKNIEATQFQCKISPMEIANISCTASCGAAEYARGESAKELFNRAQIALYDAKRLGRNRVKAKLRFLTKSASGANNIFKKQK